MERENNTEYQRPQEKLRKFVDEVAVNLEISDKPWITLESVDLLHNYRSGQGNEEETGNISFDTFMSGKRNDLLRQYGDDAYAIFYQASVWNSSLEKTGETQRPGKLAENIKDAGNALSLWTSIGKLMVRKEYYDTAEKIADIVGEADPDTVRQIAESLIARLTAGELISKPSMLLAASTLVLKDLPDNLKEDPGFYIFPAVTIMLAVAKSQQDIYNKKNGKPFLTVETSIFNSILKWDLARTAYAVRIGWLLPVMVPSVITHMRYGHNTSGILIAQSLIYLGEIGVDALLAADYGKMFDKFREKITAGQSRG